MELKINWDHKRVKHVIERMWLRGISMNEIRTAIRKGQKKRQDEGIIEAFYSYFSVVYAEKFFKDSEIHKIYPVTVKVW